MTTRTAAVVLAVLVVLAGWAGSAADDATATAEGTTTVATTADAGTATLTAESADLPPGVTESGVESATKLLAANRRELAETGYAFRLVRNDSGESLYDFRTASYGSVAKGFGPFRIRSEEVVQYGNRTARVETDTWGNESVILMKYSEQNRTVYRKWVDSANETVETNPFTTIPSQAFAGRLSHEYVVTFPLLTGEFEIESVERRDGLTLTTLRATEVNRSLAGRGSGNVSNYDATLVVDDRGLIRRATLTIAFAESTFSYDFELTEVGGVVVAYPRWAERALGTVTARVSVDVDTGSDTFAVSNEAGQVLPPGSTVRVSHDGINHTLELSESLRPGETVYVYFPAEGGAPVLTRESPAADEVAPLRGEYGFEVVDPTGSILIRSSFGFGSATPTTTDSAGVTGTIASGNETETTASAGE